MERGPVALFGAIVAVGLGPALWLGAQFGNVSVAPSAPPAIVGEQRVDTGKAPGGAGAAPADPVVEPTRRSGRMPLSSTRSARPSETADPEPIEVDEEPTTEPPAETTEPTPSDDPTTPPTEDTVEPSVSPTDGGDTEEPTGSAPPPTDDADADTTGVTLAGR